MTANAGTVGEVLPGAEADDVLDVLIVGLNYAPEPTGIAPYTTGLAEGLHRKGHHVRVIAAHPHYPWWRLPDGYVAAVVDEERNGVAIRRIKPRLPRRGGFVQRALMEIGFGLRAARSDWGQPDRVVLVSPALFASGVVAAVARWRGLHVTIWVQDIYSLGLRESGHQGLRAQLVRIVERTIFGLADVVVVIHDRFASVLSEQLDVNPERLRVVRNWSHVPQVDGLDRVSTRERLGWEVDDVVVLHAGAMGEKQGLENVLHAAALAGDLKSKVRFVLLGDGSRRAALEARRDPQARLTFLDPLPDAEFLGALAAADVLLVNERPGLSEMCVPSKLTSYLATGLPVLAATDESSITADEVMRSGAGVRVDPGDPEALLHAAEMLGDDSALAATLGRRGLAFRARYLDPTAAVAQFARVLTEGYEHVVERSSARGGRRRSN